MLSYDPKLHIKIYFFTKSWLVFYINMLELTFSYYSWGYLEKGQNKSLHSGVDRNGAPLWRHLNMLRNEVRDGRQYSDTESI